MLQLDPAQRPTILEITNHPWVKGEVPTIEKINENFESRLVAVDAEIEATREEKQALKAQAIQHYNQTYRSDKAEPQTDTGEYIPPSKKFCVYVDDLKTT